MAAPTDVDGRSGLLRWGPRVLGPADLAVMAIVNVTPDSFYDAARTPDSSSALGRAAAAVAAGATVVDIGGVKAGPGEGVDVAEECRRVLPVVEAVRAAYPSVVVSVDTWRAPVADAALSAGADVVNDSWAGADPELLAVVAAHGAGLVCTHTGGLAPRSRPHRVWYDDVAAETTDRLGALAEQAVAAGVRRDGIVVDPTHDFGKNTRHSLALTRATGDLVATGWPVLVALSRKDFVGETLDLPPAQRLEGTLAATAVAAWLGARIFRAHDVEATVRALRMVSAIRGDVEPLVSRRGLA